jgi:CheY-like chemotaxis protein
MIFLDVMLPGMDGYDVCKMIKKNKDNSPDEGRHAHEQGQDLRQDPRDDGGLRWLPDQAGGRDLKLRAIIERHTVTKK